MSLNQTETSARSPSTYRCCHTLEQKQNKCRCAAHNGRDVDKQSRLIRYVNALDSASVHVHVYNDTAFYTFSR